MRNTDWTRDELILAFELYLKKGNSPSIAEINSLSDLLRSLPIHNNIPDLERFRNANGVATKLSNIAAGDPKMDQEEISFCLTKELFDFTHIVFAVSET